MAVNFSDGVKYLGIWFDSGLTFRNHVREKCKKATRLLMAARGALGKLWGPSLITTRCMYESIVRPMITYGSVVWGGRTWPNFPPLVRVQRPALLLLSSFLRSTPTACLEAILYIMPLGTFACTMGKLLAHRIKGLSLIHI